MPCKLYEAEQFQDFCDNALRPGGLALTMQALDAARFKKESRLLDIGCGLGTTAAYLNEQGFKASGIDASASILAKAKKLHPLLDLRQGGAHELPWDNESFDGAFCECTLSVLPDPEQALTEIRRVLAIDGLFILSDFYSEEKRLPEGLSGTCIAGAKQREELQEMLEQCGFELVLWNDATDMLRQFTARIIWEYGSMQRFWRELLPSGGLDGLGDDKSPSRKQRGITGTRRNEHAPRGGELIPKCVTHLSRVRGTGGSSVTLVKLGYAWSIWKKKGT